MTRSQPHDTTGAQSVEMTITVDKAANRGVHVDQKVTSIAKRSGDFSQRALRTVQQATAGHDKD